MEMEREKEEIGRMDFGCHVLTLFLGLHFWAPKEKEKGEAKAFREV